MSSGRHPGHITTCGARSLAAATTAILFVLLTASPALAGFQPQQTFTVGSEPSAVAAADFNGDGRPDLAVVNRGVASFSVSVLLSTTAPGSTTLTFSPQVAFSTGTTPVGVATGDLNGDGKPDLAVGNLGSNTVSVLLNTTAPGAATPSFANQVQFPTGVQSQGVAVADLNDDGKPDLAVANPGSGNISVLLNQTATGAATPSFATQVPFTTGSVPVTIVAADLNGDSKPDLAVVNNGAGTVSVLLNTAASGAATPTFTAQTAFATGPSGGGGPLSAAATDLNGDGKLDLAVANTNFDTIGVLINGTADAATTPVFATQVSFATGDGPNSVVAADLNGDGKPDLAVTNFNDDTVSVLLNTTVVGAAVPSFAAQVTSPTSADPNGVVATDLNGDHKPDVAFASAPNNVGVLLSNPSGALQFGSASVTAAEGNATLTVALTRTGSTDGQVSAIVSLAGGTATQGTDFTLAAPQTVTWADGDGANKVIALPIIQDLIRESDETLLLVVALPGNPFGSTLGAVTTSTITIVDGNDQPELNIADVSVTEGNSSSTNAAFTVRRTGGTAQTITVQFTTADGTATAGTDYTVTSGTLTFAPNETSRTITVPVSGDTLAEPDETFTITLSNPTNATLGVAQGVGVIQNDDAVVACTPRPRVTQTLTAGGSALQVRVESTPLNTPANNPLQQIRFGALQNATVTVQGQAISAGQTVTIAPGVVFADLTVRRIVPGQPATVHFMVVDGCGEWNTFVGGGTAAGF